MIKLKSIEKAFGIFLNDGHYSIVAFRSQSEVGIELIKYQKYIYDWKVYKIVRTKEQRKIYNFLIKNGFFEFIIENRKIKDYWKIDDVCGF